MNWTAITNNPMISHLKAGSSGVLPITIAYYEETAEEILRRGMGLLAQGFSLAADPLGGRRARPFPCLTLLLEQRGRAIFSESDMRRLEDYLALDRKRRKRYEGLGAALLTDYRILDASLTETAFRGIERSCFHYGTKGVQNG